MSKYYVEKRNFNQVAVREIMSGTEEMLNAYPNKDILVEIRNLDITYGSGVKEFKAIKDLNLNIYDGEVLGLVGESGSGKSTTGRAIIGLTPHSFGYIKILGRTIPKNFDKVFKWSKNYKKLIDFMVNKVQMIFQDPTNSLNPFKNVEDVVGEGLTNIKNSRFIYLTIYDEATFLEINERLAKQSSDLIIYTSPLKALRNHQSNLDEGYEFVYKTFRSQLDKLVDKDPKFMESILDFLDKRQKERDESNSFTEKQCKKLLIIDMLKQVGLDESVLDRFPLEFSGGQQQRLGICRAVILQPKLLIADEPISALDVSIQAQVINIFNALKEKYHLTILFIAHDLRMVEYISDRIAVINKGVLLEVGPTDEIINNPFHPYTKSLLDAVPSIENEKGSLLGREYDPRSHGYTLDNQPKWQDLGNKHFVLASDEEVQKFKKNEEI
ncbi:ABC transporter ATP-binding protein [Mycoplasmopsis felifaucium]|uniref:ABC transporter ATP-binding protein n=1 Tax=Mycoplasmopsis felifaucium TaxID=35768 RepID=UPI0004870EEC|nr:ABC transporter ATP-binding protein [Mycoplasmopsis felifaucium]